MSQFRGEQMQRLYVSGEALARYHGAAGACGHRVMPEILSFFNVGDVYFNRGQSGTRQGIAQGNARVGISSEVYDESQYSAIRQRMDFVHQRPFMGRLKEDRAEADFFGLGADELLQ